MISALAMLLCLNSQTAPTIVRDGLAIEITPGPLSVVRKDPVEGAILSGALKNPKASETIGGATWKIVTADKDGWFSMRNGYVAVTINSPAAKTVLLSPLGASYFYVGQVPEPGDVYSYGYVAVPVRLHKGSNVIFLRSARGRVQLQVSEVKKPIALDARDATLPDVREDDNGATGNAQNQPVWASLLIENSTAEVQHGLSIETQANNGTAVSVPIPALLPEEVRKVGFQLIAPQGGDVQVRLRRGADTLDQTTVPIRFRKRGETYKRTFLSEIDGSVQYYGVNPATGSGKPALVLSLHGAGVEAMGQADAYSSKSWATIVAATNRRPYGFDWEDWGREDALEVLNQAKHTLDYDPERVYLAGHSMGGHGTWQLGVLYPNLFAAIGPSAGWISSYSYAGAKRAEKPTPLETLLGHANGIADTTSMAQNYGVEGVYILHGGADDNVPVTEARQMAELLKGFHHDYIYHEQPGMGHWWDISPEPGADCVDWAPMYDFFERHALPAEDSVRDVDFTTANPGVSSQLRWLTIEEQETQGALSHAQIHVDPHLRVFTGVSTNVARLRLDLLPLFGNGDVTISLDGQSLVAHVTAGAKSLSLAKHAGQWAIADPISAAMKNPDRYGPFRLAFNHRMIFVYGTHGNAEENRWALEKARYDAETFWYRGNASPEVIADREFDATAEPNRDVILYGNADSNSAWNLLLKSSPIQVSRGKVTEGTTTFEGKDLACLFLRPRENSATALVAAVSGSGIAGMRVTNNLPYLQPMIGFPDVLVVGANASTEGLGAIKLAGFFGLDWGVDGGEFVIPTK